MEEDYGRYFFSNYQCALLPGELMCQAAHAEVRPRVDSAAASWVLPPQLLGDTNSTSLGPDVEGPRAAEVAVVAAPRPGVELSKAVADLAVRQDGDRFVPSPKGYNDERPRRRGAVDVFCETEDAEESGGAREASLRFSPMGRSANVPVSPPAKWSGGGAGEALRARGAASPAALGITYLTGHRGAGSSSGAAATTCRMCGGTGTDTLSKPCVCSIGQQAASEPPNAALPRGSSEKLAAAVASATGATRSTSAGGFDATSTRGTSLGSVGAAASQPFSGAGLGLDAFLPPTASRLTQPASVAATTRGGASATSGGGRGASALLSPGPLPGRGASPMRRPTDGIPLSEVDSHVTASLDRFFQDEGLWQQVKEEMEKTSVWVHMSKEVRQTMKVGKQRFRVQVPKPYPGVQYRKSKCIDDRHHRYAKQGLIVTGTIEDDGEWLRVNDNDYLPMRVGAIKILEPVNFLGGPDALKEDPQEEQEVSRWWYCGPSSSAEMKGASSEVIVYRDADEGLPFTSDAGRAAAAAPSAAAAARGGHGGHGGGASGARGGGEVASPAAGIAAEQELPRTPAAASTRSATRGVNSRRARADVQAASAGAAGAAGAAAAGAAGAAAPDRHLEKARGGGDGLASSASVDLSRVAERLQPLLDTGGRRSSLDSAEASVLLTEQVNPFSDTPPDSPTASPLKSHAQAWQG